MAATASRGSDIAKYFKSGACDVFMYEKGCGWVSDAIVM